MSDSRSKPLKLTKLVRNVSAAEDLREIVEIVKAGARKMCGADGVSFILREGDKSHYVDEDGIAPLWKGSKFPLETCISGWVMIHKQSAIIGDVYSDPRIPHEVYRRTFVKSLVMVPIGDEPTAALGAYWAEPYKATAEDVQCLQALADAIAVSLKNVRLQEELKLQVKELEAAGTAKDEFLMVLSHELRTPMNIILGWAQLLLEKDDLPQDVVTAAEVIERNAKFQLHMIKDLLDVSQIVAGRLKLKSKPVDISGLLKSIVMGYLPEATKRQITLEFEANDEARIVMGDPDRLKQVFTNVIDNALKFTQENGRISVSMDRSEGFSRIRVVDTGTGFSSSFLPFAFDRFRQAESGIGRPKGGLGLGLSIVKHLIEEHGGHVKIESDGVGKGSEVILYLPVAVISLDAESVSVEDQSKTLRQKLKDARVLAVDDNPDAVHLLKAIFNKYGAEVKTCESAECAKKAIAEFKPEVMICDLSMPGEDGLTLMKKLRAEGHNLPAIALTAHVDTYYQEEAKKCGFDDYLTKPVDPSELLEATNAALSRSRG